MQDEVTQDEDAMQDEVVMQDITQDKVAKHDEVVRDWV